MHKTQVHPSTGKAIRIVKVLKVEDGVATVQAINGPLRGSVYQIPATSVR